MIPPWRRTPSIPTKRGTCCARRAIPTGLALTLIAPEDLEVQATVVSKMLEQAGFTGGAPDARPRRLSIGRRS